MSDWRCREARRYAAITGVTTVAVGCGAILAAALGYLPLALLWAVIFGMNVASLRTLWRLSRGLDPFP